MLLPLSDGLYFSQSSIISPKVLACDLDWTLIRPIHGRFPKDSDDWDFLPNRISTLKSYQDAGYTLVIFTNQNWKGAKLKMALERINNIILTLNQEHIDPWVFVATQQNNYRKPNPDMWNVFQQYLPKITEALYVGDAAGRPSDHSDDDRQFAENVKIPFLVPEDFFPNNEIIIPETQTMFIFVGMQGSGKSTFFQTKLQPLGWVHVNQDILKTQPKMLATIRTVLSQGKSVAVDATNPDPQKRAEYLKLAMEYQVPTLIIYFVRNGYEWNKLRDKPVPDIAYNIYFKKLVEPSLEIDGVPVIELS